MIHIARNGARTGAYIVEEINQKLASGEILLTDLAWTEGMSAWTPVSQIPGVIPPLHSGPPAIPAAQHFPPPSSWPPGHTVYPQTSGFAVTSLIFGIFSILCIIGNWIAVAFGITAVILGHVARSSIRQSRGQQTGDGMALAGLITGYTGLSLVVLLVLFALLFAAGAVKTLGDAVDKAARETKTRSTRSVPLQVEPEH